MRNFFSIQILRVSKNLRILKMPKLRRNFYEIYVFINLGFMIIDYSHLFCLVWDVMNKIWTLLRDYIFTLIFNDYTKIIRHILRAFTKCFSLNAKNSIILMFPIFFNSRWSRCFTITWKDRPTLEIIWFLWFLLTSIKNKTLVIEINVLFLVLNIDIV